MKFVLELSGGDKVTIECQNAAHVPLAYVDMCFADKSKKPDRRARVNMANAVQHSILSGLWSAYEEGHRPIPSCCPK